MYCNSLIIDTIFIHLNFVFVCVPFYFGGENRQNHDFEEKNEK